MSVEPEVPANDQGPRVVDPHHVETLFIDWLVTAGLFENVVNLTLGVIDYSSRIRPDEAPNAVVASRLRFSREFAIRLHAMLGDVLGLPPPAGQETPREPQKPPRNMIN